MPKVKIIKIWDRSYDLSGDDLPSIFHPASVDWEEMSESEINKLQTSIKYANLRVSEFRFVLVQYSPSFRSEVFQYASEFHKEMEDRQIKDEAEKERQKQKRKRDAEARKLKQYEKLRKEFEEK